MKPASWLALAAASPWLAFAASPTADPADPAAATPRPSYRSVFADAPRGVASSMVPWRQSNAEVARFPRGHADLLRAEAVAPTQPAARPPAAAPGTTQPAAHPPAHQHQESK